MLRRRRIRRGGEKKKKNKLSFFNTDFFLMTWV
jgi:hypothetical protein